MEGVMTVLADEEQALVSLLRSPGLAVLCILLDFLPEGLIGSTNLPGHRASYL